MSRYAVEIFDGRTLHQPASLSLDVEENVSNVYYIPLLISIVGFYGAFLSLLLIRTRTEIRERRLRAMAMRAARS
jgi:heme exporter protein C